MFGQFARRAISTLRVTGSHPVFSPLSAARSCFSDASIGARGLFNIPSVSIGINQPASALSLRSFSSSSSSSDADKMKSKIDKWSSASKKNKPTTATTTTTSTTTTTTTSSSSSNDSSNNGNEDGSGGDSNAKRNFGIIAAVSGVLTIGIAVVFLEERSSSRKTEQRKEVMTGTDNRVSSIGKALVGGPFELVDTEGRQITEEWLKGKYSLVYFGFTYCPIICPAEMDKIDGILKNLDQGPKLKKEFVPLFISVDAERDSPEQVKDYLRSWDSRIAGATGTAEQIKKAAKAYRVYYSRGPSEPNDPNDYNIDHTVVFYLMDPEGNFAKHFTSNLTAEEVARDIRQIINFGHN